MVKAMAFVTRTLPALLIAGVTTLGLLAPQAAEARNGQNLTLISGALLGLAAGSALAQSAHADDYGYSDVERAPQPYYGPRYDAPVYDQQVGYGEDYRAFPREEAPRYRAIDDNWQHYGPRHSDHGYGDRPCPHQGWRRYSED